MNKQNMLHYPKITIPQQGKITKITSEIYWIRMPLPFELDHINLWLLKDEYLGEKGWSIVDTGIYNLKTKKLWLEIIERYCDKLPILRIICTHMHPDHFGLAHWFCNGLNKKLCFPKLWMTNCEFLTGTLLSVNGKITKKTIIKKNSIHSLDFFKSHGCNKLIDQKKLFERTKFFSTMVPNTPVEFHCLMDNDNIKIGKTDWKVITCRGHSPEHACLFSKKEKILIAGDIILPNITSHIGVFYNEPDANPLKSFLVDLNKFNNLPKTTLVLPSHGLPFGKCNRRGLHCRIKELKKHHVNRTEKIMLHCNNAKSAAELLTIIFKFKLDSNNYTFALTELIAHLNYCFDKGLLKKIKINKTHKFITH